MQEALRQKLLINCTHEHILRLLPPFIVRQREVAEFLTKFAIVLERAAKSAAKAVLADSESRSTHTADGPGRDEVKHGSCNHNALT